MIYPLNKVLDSAGHSEDQTECSVSQRACGLGVKIKYTHLFKMIGPNQKPNQITVFLPVFNSLGHLTSKLFVYCHKVVPCF